MEEARKALMDNAEALARAIMTINNERNTRTLTAYLARATRDALAAGLEFALTNDPTTSISLLETVRATAAAERNNAQRAEA